MFLADDEPEPGNITRQHWYFHRPLLNMITGGENFRIEYPDAFDDVVWEYAQGEWNAAIKDEYTYAEWFINTRSSMSTEGMGFGEAPPSNISADTAEKFKTRILETLKGHTHEKTLKNHVNDIMNRTRNTLRGAGVERARTNPVVEDAMRNPAYRAWRIKAHRAWF